MESRFLALGLIPATLILVAAPDSARAATTCVFDTTPSTMSLTADCTTDEPIFVPDGVTLDGQGNTITAVDPPGDHFKGGVIRNAVGATEAQALAQIHRYMVWPGQALGYKLGALKLQALRERARQRLGSRFDLAAFHDAVLAHGVLPLAVLEANIERWISAQR